MTCKYKIGQKVVLRGPKQVNGESRTHYNSAMNEYLGRTTTLTQPEPFLWNGVVMPFWRVAEDGGYWNWLESWFDVIGCPCNIKTCIAKHSKGKA